MNMKIIYNFAIGLSLLTMSSQVFAQRVTPLKAGYFLKMCKDSKDFKACDGYIAGVADAVAYSKIYAQHQNDKNAPVGFCIPPVIKGIEMRQKVVSWMETHKDQLDQTVGLTVFKALHESYPCKIIKDGN